MSGPVISLDQIHKKLNSDLQLPKGSNPKGTKAKRQAAGSFRALALVLVMLIGNDL